jgi:ABC-type transporter lipoprotein component MlaA
VIGDRRYSELTVVVTHTPMGTESAEGGRESAPPIIGPPIHRQGTELVGDGKIILDYQYMLENKAVSNFSSWNFDALSHSKKRLNFHAAVKCSKNTLYHYILANKEG